MILLMLKKQNISASKKPSNYWKDLNNVRAFFNEFALEQGFDPTDPQAWYSCNIEQAMVKKGGFTIREQYRGLRLAVKQAYPELALEEWGKGT